MSSRPTKLPAAEVAKLESHGLRGGLAEALDDPDQDSFAKGELAVLKFHGIYQQENRDERAERRAAGLGKRFTYMIRVAIPGGAMTAEQYLALDALASAYSDGSVRLTTRQAVQFHGTRMDGLRPTLQTIHESLLTTFAACGDVRRNVMACTAPLPGGARVELQRTAEAIATELEPRTGAYHEIWLDGEKQTFDTASEAEEPFYGKEYLPRKFKIGLATEDDNCVDAYTQDCALVAIVRDDAIVGYNLLAGGGFGMTHNRPDTFARIASPIGFVPPDRAVDVVRVVAAIFRDHGNREDRRHARLKYLIESWGVERFRDEVRARIDWHLDEPRPLQTPHQYDHLGEHEQAGGGRFYGLWVENGRLKERQRDGVRAIVERFRPGVRITAMQNLLFTDLDPADVPALEALIDEHGLERVDALPNAVRGAMACPALPTCGLALADAERFLPSVTRRLADRLDALGLADVPLIVRMTGCPNGCARPYNADIGFVGRRPGVYHVFVGGGVRGDRLADLWQGDVAEDELISVLDPLLEHFADERLDGETLSDFYQRHHGSATPRQLLTGREEPAARLVALGSSA